MFAKGFFHHNRQMYIFTINGGYVNIWKPERESVENHGELTPVYWRSPTMHEWYDDGHTTIMQCVDSLTQTLQSVIE
jgi:hypothetical protein